MTGKMQHVKHQRRAEHAEQQQAKRLTMQMQQQMQAKQRHVQNPALQQVNTVQTVISGSKVMK